MIELETERLRLRQWRQDHFEPFAAMFADAETARYLGRRCTRAEAWRRMATAAGHWALLGYGPWAVEEKASGALVGRIGLWRPEGWPELELVWGLLRDHHGKGYATEAARCARDHAFEAMGVDTLVSYIHPDNEPSKRVAERLGARLEQTIELFGEPAGVYRHIAA